MSEFQEISSALRLTLKGKIEEQLEVFRGYLRTMFGLNKKQVGQFQEFSEPTEAEELRER